MFIVSSFFDYTTNIFRGQEVARSRHNNTENGEEPEAPYELVDDAMHDRCPTVTGPSCADTATLNGGVPRPEIRPSTPRIEGRKEDGGGSPAEIKKRRKHKYKVLFGLALPFALQSLDTTIIASALPFIAADFGMSILGPVNAIPRMDGEVNTLADVSTRRYRSSPAAQLDSLRLQPDSRLIPPLLGPAR